MGFNIENGVLTNYTEERGVTEVVVPDGVTEIGSEAFYECSSLISITIPASVTKIGDYVFCECSSLSSIDVDENNNMFSSVDGIIYNKKKLY